MSRCHPRPPRVRGLPLLAALGALLGALLMAGCATAPAPAALAVAAAPAAAPSAESSDTPAPQAAPRDTASTREEATPPAAMADRPRDAAEGDGDHSDLWVRLRGGLVLADLDNDLVRKWEQWYARDPAYVQRMTERGGRYLFHILEEVQRRELPTELALLPFIESAFNPQAESRARASGMWQFMPATGKHFELRQNVFRDDRRGVLASTRAALDYLQMLNAKFGDWQLALAAYNWGQGNVARALEKNRRAGLPLTYEALRMPNETREYVPKLQAVKNIVLRPEAFGLQLPPLQNHPYFLSVAIERDIDVDVAARLSGLSLEAFQQLNPQMNKPVILAAGTPQVLLPYDNANRFLRELAEHQGPLARWTAWVAPRTLKPAEAARLIGTSEEALRETNRIPPRMLVKAGSTLLVPRAEDATDDVAGHIAQNALLDLAPEALPPHRISFKAGQRGDSVAAVARRYGVSAAQVAQWNRVGVQAHFKAGQTIEVQVPAKARAPVRVAQAQTHAKSHAQPQARKTKAAAPVRKRQVASAGGTLR